MINVFVSQVFLSIRNFLSHRSLCGPWGSWALALVSPSSAAEDTVGKDLCVTPQDTKNILGQGGFAWKGSAVLQGGSNEQIKFGLLWFHLCGYRLMRPKFIWVKYKYIYICGKIVPYTHWGSEGGIDLGLWRLEKVRDCGSGKTCLILVTYLNTSLNTAPHISEPQVLHLQS